MSNGPIRQTAPPALFPPAGCRSPTVPGRTAHPRPDGGCPPRHPAGKEWHPQPGCAPDADDLADLWVDLGCGD